MLAYEQQKWAVRLNVKNLFDTVSYEPNKQWGVRLNIQNLFDKIYYDSLYDNGGFGVPGTRRRLLGTVTYKFS